MPSAVLSKTKNVPRLDVTVADRRRLVVEIFKGRRQLTEYLRALQGRQVGVNVERASGDVLEFQLGIGIERRTSKRNDMFLEPSSVSECVGKP